MTFPFSFQSIVALFHICDKVENFLNKDNYLNC